MVVSEDVMLRLAIEKISSGIGDLLVHMDGLAPFSVQKGRLAEIVGTLRDAKRALEKEGKPAS